MKLPASLALAVLAAASTRGDDANTPAPSRDYDLRVQGRPLVQRAFMPGSSPRSIAVGLPGGVSFCFDAESCRLRYAWSGGFLNMQPAWKDRGAEPPRLLGTKFFTAPDLMPLRIGGNTAKPQVKFGGYALANKLPEFRFTVDGVAVKQRVEATGGGGLRCAFEMGATKEEVFFNAPEGVRVSTAGRDLVRDDKGWVKVPRGMPTRFEASIPGPAATSTER